MNLRLVVRPEVDADLLEAEAWYEEQESGLGQKFLKATLETIDRLLQIPSYIGCGTVDAKCVGRTRGDFHIKSYLVSGATPWLCMQSFTEPVMIATGRHE